MPEVEGSSFTRNRGGVAVAIAMAVAVSHLLAVDLGDHAPLRAASRLDWPDRVAAGHFTDADAIVRRAAAGHNLQLVIESPDQADTQLQNLFTQLYFRAVYTLTPNRIFVGEGDRVINDWSQLSHAASNPGPAFEASHDVRNVLTLSAAGGAMSLQVRPAE